MSKSMDGASPEGLVLDGASLSTLTLLERITRQFPNMRRSEAKVATLVLDDPSGVVRYTMAGLAEAANVSEPTVMRFCASIGCEGFQDFKIQLAQTIALGLPVTHSAISVSDSVADLSEKIFDHTISSLDRSRRTLDASRVGLAIDAVLSSSDLLFIGFGASGIIAQDAQQKFPLFGVPCQAPTDFHQQFIAATMSQRSSVVFAISNTGHTAQTLTAATAAKKAGACLVTITGRESALSEMADIPIFLRTFEDTDLYTPSTSRLAGLVLIDILATGVALRRPPELSDAIRRMKSELSSMRQASRLHSN